MKNIIIIFLCLILTFTLSGCTNINNTSNIIKDEKSITSMKIHDMKAQFKEINSKTDIDQALDLVKSVKIIKSDVKPIDGVGYGVEITYSDGEKENINFSGTYMFYGGKYYEVNKNIVNDLKSIYDKN